MGIVTSAKAEYIDLSQGGMQVSQPMRCDEDRPQVCVIVEKDDKLYIVVLDTNGEVKIFLIENGEPRLIWARD